MKKYKYKIAIIFFATLILLFFNGMVCNAATAGISASKTEATVGENVNINVSINAITWNIKVNGAGISDTVPGANTEEFTNKTTNKSYKLDTSKPGTYTVNLTGDVTDADGTSADISKSVTVTVKEKVETPKEEEPKKPVEPTFTDKNETVYVTNTSVNVRASYSSSSKLLGSLKKGESVTRTGISTNGWSKVSYNGSTAYIISTALSTTEPQKEEEKSSNKALKELTVENYTLTPEFNPQTTKYSVDLTSGEEKLTIKAIPEDEKANVDITGNENFKVGNNIVKITVTAEDGTTRIYSITVSKSNEDSVVDSLKLSSLKVSKGTLEPNFDPSITSYVITIEDPSTIKIEDIVATAADENVDVTVAENEQTESGEKIITIMLESKDGSKTGVYQISVKKPVQNQMITTQSDNKDNSIYYILGGIIGILLLLIIIIIIILKRTSKSDEDYDEDDMRKQKNGNDDEDEADNNYDYSLKNAIDEANSEYDEMVEDSKYKTQVVDNSNFIENTNIYNNENVTDDKNDYMKNEDDNEDFKPNITPKKKGKHF